MPKPDRRKAAFVVLAASLGALASLVLVGMFSSPGAALAPGSPRDVLTFHRDNLRTGWIPTETVLTVANVKSPRFGKLATLAVSGKVYAQPLYVTGETVADGSTHDLVIVATATDQLYAFDATTGAQVWHRSFINPPRITQQSWKDTNCGDVNPDVGIVGTPVADRSLDRLFVVVPTAFRVSVHLSYFNLTIHAVSLKDGSDAVPPRGVVGSTGVGSTAQSISPLNNFNRAGLLEANGNVYVALGSHCDKQAATTHGWLVSYDTNTLKPTGNLLNTVKSSLPPPPPYFLGSPWMAGFAPAADAQGNVYFSTGNGPFDGTKSFSMSVLKVPPNLDIKKATYFTPGTWSYDSEQDSDLASGGVMLLPDQPGTYPHLLITGGKCRIDVNGNPAPCNKYILNRDNLGGAQATPSPYPYGPQTTPPALWQADTGGDMWGGPAYFTDATGTKYVLYGGGLPGNTYTNGMLSTYKLGGSPPALTLANSATYSGGCLQCRSGGSQPVVSSNGTRAGTAVVWVVQTPDGRGGNLSLFAFDPATMGTLFSANAGNWLKGPGASYQGGAMVSPLIAGGKVYVPAQGTVTVFGLK